MQVKVVSLDSRRPKVYEQMYCLFCGTEHAMVHTVGNPLAYYGPCPGCDEDASVPMWRVVKK